MASADFSNVRPETLFALNLGLGAMILVTWFVIRALHGLRPRWLTSVVPRMRWKFFAICLGLSVIALTAQVAVGSVLPGDAGGGVGGKLNDFTTSTALAALVVLLTTPLQAAGEEYVFRGYLLQALGSLFSNRWIAIGTTGLLFALAHGVQNFPLFFDRLAFGLIAAWLVIRTGGLEAGIALHVLNNFLAFGLALSYGNLSETLNVTEASWWNIVLTVTQSAVYAALVVYVARRMGLQTHTRPPSTQPGPASTGSLAPA
jgi:membrane protease YdiL (CAAX protease family)